MSVHLATGLAVELLTGVLGAMQDESACTLIEACEKKQYDILIDDGYSARHVPFVRPVGAATDAGREHTRWRSRVEHFWSRVCNWQLLSNLYKRDKTSHTLLIRCVCIITNIKIVKEQSIYNYYFYN